MGAPDLNRDVALLLDGEWEQSGGSCDGACEPGERCHDGECYEACTTTVDCDSEGQQHIVCDVENDICVPEKVCESDDDCPYGQACDDWSDSCVLSCESEEDCPGGLTGCDESRDYCVALECASDLHCDSFEECIEGYCGVPKPHCQSHDDCSDNYYDTVCRNDGACVECLVDRHCKNGGQHCVDARCEWE